MLSVSFLLFFQREEQNDRSLHLWAERIYDGVGTALSVRNCAGIFSIAAVLSGKVTSYPKGISASERYVVFSDCLQFLSWIYVFCGSGNLPDLPSVVSGWDVRP